VNHHKLSEVNKEEVTLNGNLDISWKSKNMPLDSLVEIKSQRSTSCLKDTFSLTISTLIGKREQFFYYNDLLKNVPLFIANIHESHKDVLIVFFMLELHKK
jgi:hypothetical protein